MPFQLSPGVNVTEVDLTGIVPAVATTDGAIAGVFNWGPIGTRQLIDTETKLVSTFGKPSSNNAETWFTAANFLSYGNRLYVTRVTDTENASYDTMTAVANTGAVSNLPAQVVKNTADYGNQSFDANVYYVARYAGALGNSLKISVCDGADAFSSVLEMDGQAATENLDVSANLSIAIGATSANLVVTAGGGGSASDANTYVHNLVANLSVGDVLTVGNAAIGTQNLRISSIGSVVGNSSGGFATITFDSSYRLSTAFTTSSSLNTNVTRNWEFSNVVDTAPTTSDYVAQFGNSAAVDGIHVVVVDQGGKFTGVPGTVLETFPALSRATDAKTVGGQINFYQTVINQSSKYVWFAQDRSGAVSNTAANIASSTNKTPFTLSFKAGRDGYSESDVSLATVAGGYDLYKSAEDVDVSLILQGKPIGDGGTYQLANYLIDNICETRKDCIALISPDDTVVVGNAGNEANSLVAWRNNVHDSSYAVMDSGYKYMYDRYNDVYRYIPCNGDVAGLCARTDSTRDPWWSPAGFNRGQIKNLVKLRWNPRQADRDILYKNGVNPIVSFPGQGTVLYGDKTLQTKPSAFDRINVRRLFIVLEKAIATASKFFLFEFNDEFTRAQFKNLITPYLRDVQARRGITDFLVVCDGTNNTGERIDRNEFWGDIYIKPARSINFIQLNFVAVRSGVQFSEIVGKF
jgi:phage tail sheath protein FI